MQTPSVHSFQGTGVLGTGGHCYLSRLRIYLLLNFNNERHERVVNDTAITGICQRDNKGSTLSVAVVVSITNKSANAPDVLPQRNLSSQNLYQTPRRNTWAKMKARSSVSYVLIARGRHNSFIS